MSQYDFPFKREIAPLQHWIIAALGAPMAFTAPDPSRLVLWSPVSLAAGIAVYFALPFEPWPGFGIAVTLTAFLAFAVALIIKRSAVTLYLGALASCLAIGFALAQHRTTAIAPYDLSAFSNERSARVSGWIERIERSSSRPRVLLRVTALEHTDIAPKRIRVRLGLGEFTPGDGVNFVARLSRPGGPVASGGYDPARAAWFDHVALSGYAITELQAETVPAENRFERSVVRFRWMLAERIRSKAGERTGAIAAALLTGDRAQVAEEDAEALRMSGLGHILAISGLHMALFAGGVYWLFRFVIAAIEPVARAHDPRKPAAMIALLAASGYLILSGAAVSTQRAYVMAVVVLLGVIFDRRAFSLRSLALAALIVLIIAPESLIEPGFQMSFSAVAALIAIYDAWSRLTEGQVPGQSFVAQAWRAFAGLAATSVIAGGATGAFAAFHFQRMAAYGLIANLAAMPVFTFWVMPAGGAALAASVIGLDGPFLWFMDKGLRIVLAIAHWTSGLEGAYMGSIAAEPAYVALYGAGFALAAMGLGLVRVAGLGLLLVSIVLWLVQTPPSLMVTDGGVVIARFEGDEDGFTVSNSRRGRFDARVFLQRIGYAHRPARAPLHCDDLGCTGWTVEGLRIAVTDRHEALIEDCQMADLVVFEGRASAWRKRRCEAMLLDDGVRAELGGAEFWVQNGRVVRVRSAEAARRARLWAQDET